ncbi:hypothetical protein MANES_07G086200v8 [Manihot esculenta]|uniref:Uncharacterized protein n=1 Tax=Manihot esculenta TaxID=3983 RepID=A0ACB7HGB3_MANES|nr:hypothetical protein MANES_07G086200v8 [Manihot esculenta]
MNWFRNKEANRSTDTRGNQILEWKNRMKIAIGSAKGLEYLHELCKPKIIHRDIKADNILVDDKFEPKVTDFGLALFFPETGSLTHISRSNNEGTEIYADPENYHTKKISEKLDVYAYGVVLLELITGRKTKFEGMDIISWAKPRIEYILRNGDYTYLVDSKLQANYIEGELKIMIFCAAACVYKPSNFRPPMKQIVRALEGYLPIKDIWDEKDDIQFLNNNPNLDRSHNVDKFQHMVPKPLIISEASNGNELRDFTQQELMVATKGSYNNTTKGIERFQDHYEPKSFNYRDLIIATEGFSEDNRLAEGPFGLVYKGDINGEKVTIAKFSNPKKHDEEYEKMKAIGSGIHHKNLVNLIGYCEEGANRLLVYEFVPRGKSLRYYLKGEEQSTLDWKTRMSILDSVAELLCFLLEQGKFYNRDITEDWIDDFLIDDDFLPKFAEYGREKFFSDFAANCKSIRCTAPESANSGEFTQKTSVYYYGLMLVEMITGKETVADIVQWVVPQLKRAQSDGNYDFIDKRLKEYNKIEMDGMIACALACLSDNPQDRPEMNQIRTHAIRKYDEDIHETLKAAEAIFQAEARILSGPHEDLKSYLAEINQLRSNIHVFSNNKNFKSSEAVLDNANNLLAKAISKLEEEFKRLLSSYSKPVEHDRLLECLPESKQPSSGSPANHDSGKIHYANNHFEQHNSETSGFKYLTLIPSRILCLLHDLAQQIVQAGHQQELLIIYGDIRSPFLEKSLHLLGVEKPSEEDMQVMEWELIEAKASSWISFMRIAVKVLFAGERSVCDQIFDGFDTLADQCFAGCSGGSVSMLLSFGEAIAKGKRSPEKLFLFLDICEIMRELHSEIEAVFNGMACTEIRESTFGLIKRLAQTAQAQFYDFEEAVEKDATKTALLDGTVHPLTSYVIHYVKFILDYQSTLKQLFQEFESGGETGSQLASWTTRIMQALQTNLDGKSKQYKDPALTYLFLMNNIHYMVRSVNRSKVKDLLGDDWVQTHRRLVQNYANQYKRSAWVKIFQCLSAQALTSSVGGSQAPGGGGSRREASRGLVKDRFKTFNMQFEELHHKQSQWTVPDTELRESLRLAVAEVLLPAYRSFVKRFGPLIETEKNPQKYIKYSVEDLNTMLGEFFEGKF